MGELLNKKTLPQELVPIICQDDRYVNNLAYCEGIDRFCFYIESEGYYKILETKELERELFRFIMQRWPKPLSIHFLKDVIGMMKHFIYNRIEDVVSDYITINDKTVINMKTFELEEATFQKHSFYKVNCSVSALESTTLPEIFKNYLEFVLIDEETKEPDQELITLVQEMFGYYLLNTLEAHAAFFLVGSGGNGKSVMLDIIQSLIGVQFCQAMSIESLTTNRFSIAELIGKKVNICREEESKYIKSDKFKALISGDPVTVEHKYEQSFMWKPTVKYLFATNEIPTFTGLNEGLTRRIHIIPFNRRIPEEMKDTKITQKIIDQQEGVLAWALQGAKKLVQNNFKFTIPTQVIKKKEEFIKNISSAVLYIKETYEKDENSFISQDDLYVEYKLWCEKRGKKAFNFYGFCKDIEFSYDIKPSEGRNNDSEMSYGYKLKRVSFVSKEENIKIEF